jgi:hypothetical protein
MRGEFASSSLDERSSANEFGSAPESRLRRNPLLRDSV